MPITKKVYYCPLCLHEEPHWTNHNREIYARCANCDHFVMYCKDSEVLETIFKVRVVTYRFNTETQVTDVLRLFKKLREKGYSKITLNFSYKETKLYEELAGEEVNVTGDMGDQLVTSRGRLFWWTQFNFQNPNIVAGYYLERIE